MSQVGFTPIQLYRSATPGAVPLAGNLAPGELAINTADQKLFFENASGTVVASVPFNTTGILGVANGGTGTATTFTTGSVVFAGASGVYSQDNASLFWDDTNNRLGVGTAAPTAPLEVSQTGAPTAAIQITSSGSNPYMAFTDALGSAAIASGGGTLYLRSGGTGAVNNRVYIVSSGNVGIAAASPPQKLTLGTGNIQLADTFSLVWGGTANYITGSNASNYLALATSSAERMRITDAGNVGIGTTSPGYKLDVSATGNISGQFKTSGSINALFLADAGTTAETLYIGTVGNDFRVVTASNERMRITAAGNVGIGTSSPSAKLNVAGDTIISGNADARQIGFNFYGTSQYNFYVDGATDAAKMTIRSGTTSVATFDGSGNVGIGTNAPTTGSMSNTAILNAGIFITHRGSVSTTSGVATTIAVAAGDNNVTYIVSCGVASADPVSYNAVAIVSGDAGVFRVTTLQTAVLMTISVSGSNIQATQSAGGPATIQYSIIRIS